MTKDNEIPRGWRQVSLSQIGRWFGGGTPSKFEPLYWTDGSIPWVSPKDMKSLHINDTEDHLTSVALQRTNIAQVPPGTVLFVIRSGILSRTFPVAVVGVTATMNQDMKGVKPCEGIEPLFIAYQLIARERELLNECAKDGTTVASIDTGRLHAFKIVLSPEPEQRRILAKIEELLSHLDAGVAALQRVKANLKRYRATILNAAVTGRLTEEWRGLNDEAGSAQELLSRIHAERQSKLPKEKRTKLKDPIITERTVELPPDWRWVTPTQLVASQRHSLAIGPFGSNLKVSDYTEEGVPLVFVRNIRSGHFGGSNTKFVSSKKAQELHAHSVEAGDILITKMGEPPGDARLYPAEYPMAIITADCIKLRLHPFVTSPSFFVHAINSAVVRRQIATITKGVAQQKISLGRFEQMQLPVPPLDEQKEIVSQVETRLSIIDVAEAEVEHGLKRAARLRKAILKRAFEGKLVPQYESDVPLSVPAHTDGDEESVQSTPRRRPVINSVTREKR
jgi:type I restriction enzyme S subunit